MVRFDDYLIDADSYSVNAYRIQKGKSKKGEEIETKVLIGYYGKFEGAVKACREDAIKRHLAQDKVETLSMAWSAVKRITEHFEQLLTKKEGVSPLDR